MAPGRHWSEIAGRMQAFVEAEGLAVVRDFVGHGIGREMHEDPQVPNYGKPGQGTKLKKGMAICIEPMFNLGGEETRVLDDGWSVVTADGSLSAHEFKKHQASCPMKGKKHRGEAES